MYRYIKSFFCLAFLTASTLCNAQSARYSTANAHAHNDYLNKTPFFLAYINGFGSIEADVFPVGEKLCVAHSKKEIDTLRTLDSLYLQSFLKITRTAHVIRPFILLVDIKEDYQRSLALLIKALEPVQPYLDRKGEKGVVKVVISGSRPPPVDFKNYPDFIFFDDDLRQKHTAESWQRVALVSLPFNRISSWKGKGRISKADRQKVQHIIDSTHQAGKPIRFWAAPDTKKSWKLQRRLKADLIGTDRVADLAAWLRK
jgi:hypothetical protein